ncbi:uncharacterized protein BDW43DRAFT_282006 [Aspergillus alliaceus]|uniref:uncharacterized protein n=1 Tax=Petromyces alliaceus TaxID=209559 RepID=UPI0012A5787C|nr:uncharacterized protein BDW43DRAFT_282006 [Aspergillus alliaceus]KAB8231622.1 hypothetical protein BDW43DRAFT_282006 [Aspergillus alliaceus]
MLSVATKTLFQHTCVTPDRREHLHLSSYPMFVISARWEDSCPEFFKQQSTSGYHSHTSAKLYRFVRKNSGISFLAGLG